MGRYDEDLLFILTFVVVSFFFFFFFSFLPIPNLEYQIQFMTELERKGLYGQYRKRRRSC